MTAVMRRADERFSASIRIKSSIRLSLAGNDVDWTMNTSWPRTFSCSSTKISRSAKRRTTPFVIGSFRWAQMASAKGRLLLPATSFTWGPPRPFPSRASKGILGSAWAQLGQRTAF